VISVIVPVRNGLPWLEEQLRALTEQECHEPWEVIVADNNSTDESRLVVQDWMKRSERMRLVDASRVRGAAAARNVGVESAEGELLAFCDADDVVQPGWLTAHVSALAMADLSAGVFDEWSLNGLDPPDPPRYEPAGAIGLMGFLPSAATSNLAIRRQAFEAIGGFSEDLTLIGEDFDLCWRSQLAGHRFELNMEAVVAKRERSGFKAIFSRYVIYGRSGPMLYRRFRADGLPRNLAMALKAWVWLLLSIPRLRRPDFREVWASVAGWRCGCLVESVTQRVLYL
jgi:GT2 family glycosyltransferase